jgi:hypothetical protein
LDATMRTRFISSFAPSTMKPFWKPFSRWSTQIYVCKGGGDHIGDRGSSQGHQETVCTSLSQSVQKMTTIKSGSKDCNHLLATNVV